jgi:hypothetical protein
MSALRPTARALARATAPLRVLQGQDKWRSHPTLRHSFWDLYPGVREGAALFAVYVAYDQVTKAASHGHGGHGHGAAEHHGAAAAAGHGDAKH